MEMEVINKEDERYKETYEDEKELPKVKTEEKAEEAHYSSLVRPQEDVYSEAIHIDKKAETEVKKEEKTQVYKKMCAVLSVVCLILLLVVIYLSIKSPTGSPACPDPKPTVISQKCSEQTCQALYNFPPKVKLPCEDDWSFFKGSCYFLSTLRKNWAESQSYCTSKGGSLAVISSLEVQDFLSNQGDLMYWIGLSRSNGIWTWVNNAVPETGYWAEAKQQGDCVFLQTKGNAQKNWIKGNCQQHSYFICQLQT